MGSRLKKQLKFLSNSAVARMYCYRLKVTLLGTNPPVWRLLQLDGEFELGAIHTLIQEMMGWTNEHLHSFVVNGVEYVDTGVYEGRRPVRNHNVQLHSLRLKEGDRFSYEYNFDTRWKHEIVVEQIIKLENPDDYDDLVLDGAGACPPESCGGIEEYNALLAAYRDTSNDRHSEAMKLFGKKFDPAVWDKRDEYVAAEEEEEVVAAPRKRK